MKILNVLTLFGLILISSTEYAFSDNHSDKKEVLIVKVKGMVCAFCAQGIEKNFNKQKEVESTKVDLDTMEVAINLKAGKKLAEEKIKEIVTDAGFSYVGIKK